MKLVALWGSVVSEREFDLKNGGKGKSIKIAVFGGTFEFNLLSNQQFKVGDVGYWLTEFKEVFGSVYEKGFGSDKYFSRSALLPKSIIRFDSSPTFTESPEKHFGMCK